MNHDVTDGLWYLDGITGFAEAAAPLVRHFHMEPLQRNRLNVIVVNGERHTPRLYY